LTVFKKETTERVSEKVDLQIGDYASVRDTNSVGIVSEFDKEKNKAVLNVGTLKIKTKYSDLVPARKSEIEKPFSNKFDLDQNEVSYRLDLRGMRGEEAEFEILKFLDSAHMNGTDRVEILHGKGTGILKQITHTTLKKYPSVKKYYYSNIEFGGEGITIVEFK
jgi:DNA mismatch repair protein MutS2